MSPVAASPLVREIALSDPRVALAALAGLPNAFLLHSGAEHRDARWSFFGADPFATFGPGEYDEGVALWRARRAAHARTSEAFGCHAPGIDAPPFVGGIVGAWSYDFGRRLERVPAIARDDVGWPDVWLAAYDVIGAFHHASGRAWLIATGDDPRAKHGLDALARRFEARDDAPARAGGAPEIAPRAAVPFAARCTFTPDGYRAAVERVREHIRCGDIFQANLSQRWSLPLAQLAPGPVRRRGHRAPAAAAREIDDALARLSPAPFAAFLDLGGRALASASPESFLTVRGGEVTTRPIKGTRPRGVDAVSDAANRAALIASAKDRAENVMIVDVLRNDLGRVCETGSVATPELCVPEAFAQVFHLTSTVTGRLRADRDAADLLHACFPGGSITGAPKIRAMEILESLEPVRRHAYTGAIGYLDWSGDAAWSIAIRTAMVAPDAIHFAAGGGIVADSDPDAEYFETLTKAEGLRRALSDVFGPMVLAPDSERGAAARAAERPAAAEVRA